MISDFFQFVGLKDVYKKHLKKELNVRKLAQGLSFDKPNPYFHMLEYMKHHTNQLQKYLVYQDVDIKNVCSTWYKMNL